jgi:hypothetical protein
VRGFGQLPGFEDVLAFGAGQVASGGFDFSEGIDFSAAVDNFDWEGAASAAGAYGLNEAINAVQGSSSPTPGAPLPTAPPAAAAMQITMNKPIVPPAYPPPPPMPPPPAPPQTYAVLETLPAIALTPLAPPKKPVWPLFVALGLAATAYALS